MNSVRIFSDLNHLAEAMALRFSEEARQAAREDRLYSVVLTGGVTASKIYRLFGAPGSGDNIPWESVHLFWTDERCVPPESNESNFGTAHRAFLNDLSIPDENIHRIDGEDNPAVEANRYACEIQSHLKLRNNSKYCFDWVLMGLGMDGHTASLFPGQEALLNPQGFCDVAEHPETKQKRITLTAPMLQRAKHITYHVVGSEKAEVISELISESSESQKYPAARIHGEWYLDKAAASSLNHLLEKPFTGWLKAGR
jgi:6-phosphogluconolactonase